MTSLLLRYASVSGDVDDNFPRHPRSRATRVSSTLSQAVSRARNNSLIVLYPGTYACHVVLTNSLHLVGAGLDGVCLTEKGMASLTTAGQLILFTTITDYVVHRTRCAPPFF